MKIFLYGKSSGHEIPDKFEEKVAHSDKLDKFKKCFENLHNSFPTTDSMMKVKADCQEGGADDSRCEDSTIMLTWFLGSLVQVHSLVRGGRARTCPI